MSRVTNTLIVADSLVIVPQLDDLVLSGGDEVLSLLHDGQGVDLTNWGAVEHADGLSVEAVPVGDLAVRSSGQQLRLVWVVKHLLEHGGLEQAHDASVRHNVPNDARSVVRR